jgi:hypothetical protein
MRRFEANAVAGNCCCLIPVLILVMIIVAAVIGAAVVWYSAVPNMFRWESAHHHSDTYGDGYEEGYRVGARYAARGEPEPAGQDLDALALGEADRLHVTRDRKHWIQGFRSGFARGFGSFNTQAFRNRTVPLDHRRLDAATSSACPPWRAKAIGVAQSAAIVFNLRRQAYQAPCCAAAVAPVEMRAMLEGISTASRPNCETANIVLTIRSV